MGWKDLKKRLLGEKITNKQNTFLEAKRNRLSKIIK